MTPTPRPPGVFVPLQLIVSVGLLAGEAMPLQRSSAEERLQCRCRGSGGQLGHDDGEPFGSPTPDSGNGRRYAPDRTVDVLHIRIDVTPDFARHTVRGTTSLTFRPIATPLEQLRLDGVDLTVSGVRADVPVADHTVTRDSITIRFAEAIPVDREVTLHIDHEAEPRRGLYFRTPDMGYPAGDTHVWTQGESHEARHWFPCHDYPNERSTTEVICHVPPEMAVLSNGRLVGEEVDPASGLKAVHWLQDKPHVSYLVCLVAGHLSKLEGRHRDVPLGFYTQPSTAAQAANSFEDTASIMAFFEEDIGVAYPWDKYDQVTIQDFVAGGMENTSLTTLTDHTLHTKATENIRSSRALDAHELAHQWFGDLVTCKDWSHLWLNEGFATYYAHLYDGHKFGRDELLYGLWNDAESRLLPQGEDTRPIVWKGYKDASEQFDHRAYPKGSWVLHMLRSQFGDDLYRRAVKAYLERHALATVTTDDLRQVFEELSGRPLDRFFDQWLYHGRHPDLRVEYQWRPQDKLAHLSVRQTQAVSDKVLTFAFDTTVRFVFEDGTSVDRPITVTGTSHDFYFPLERQPTIVRFDPRSSLLAMVDFPLPEAMHLAQLDRGDDCIGRIIAVRSLERSRTRTAIERLGRVVREDGFRGVREQAAQALQAIGSREALAELLASLEQPDARVRRRVVEGIARFYRPEVMEKLVAVAGSEANPAIRAVAIRGLAKYQELAAREVILDALRSDSFRQEVAESAMEAIAASQDATLLQPLVRVVQSKPDAFPSLVMATALRTAGRLGSLEADKSPARRFIEPALHDSRPPVREAAIAALGELGDRQAVAVLEGFAHSGSSDRLGKAAERALDALRNRMPPVPEEVKELRQQVKKLEETQERLQKTVDTLEQRFQARPEAAPAPLPPAPPAVASP
jgi:aminopeptidase N